MRNVVLFLVISLAASHSTAQITRGDTSRKNIALVFTGDEFGDGGNHIRNVLKKHNVKASFFLTGNFYRNPAFRKIIKQLVNDGHYMGSHSDKHLLYCSWENRDSLLVTHEEFMTDLKNSYDELDRWGVTKNDAHYFLPPYEWYNDSIVEWTKQFGLQLVNFSPGTRSTADYTYPEMGSRYVGSKEIYQSIIDFEKNSSSALNGFILLVHIGTDPRRTDKFYNKLGKLIPELKSKGYSWVRIGQVLSQKSKVISRKDARLR